VIGNVVFKAVALDLRHKSLTFLSQEENINIWYKLYEEIRNKQPSASTKTEFFEEENVDEPDKPQ